MPAQLCSVIHGSVALPSRAVMGVMALGGLGAGPGPGMPGVRGPLPGWRRRGCRRPRRRGCAPKVIGLPPCDLQQVRLGAAVQRRGEDGVLEFLVLPPAERGFGQELLSQAFQLQRVGAGGPAPVHRIGGQAKEDLAGEGVVAGMQRLEVAQQLDYLGVPPSSRIRRAAAASSGVGCLRAISRR